MISDFWKGALTGALSGAALTLAAVFVLPMAGCNERDKSFKPASQGAPYEIVVVADHNVWDGPAGDSLRAALHRRFPTINREETYFKTLRVLPQDFKKLVSQHRNVLVMNIVSDAAEASVTVGRDRFAREQTVMAATAPDMESLTRLISAERENIMLAFENAEKERDVAAATGHTPKAVAEAIRQKFGMEFATGPGYTIQKTENETDDFLWLAYKMPAADQGIIIYSYPFSGVKDFDRENLIRRRNEFVARIPGENPGSHMITVDEVNELIYKKIDGRQWAAMGGLWDVKGDFLGGPYRNYSTLDAANQRVIAIDFYVYSPDPRFGQRNYVKQLEHLVYTAKISGEIPTW